MEERECFLLVSQMYNSKPTYSIFEKYENAYDRMEAEYQVRMKDAMEMMECEIEEYKAEIILPDTDIIDRWDVFPMKIE